MINSFTFGVLTYNQEKEVLATLNSIKYQVEQYGSGYACRLIITDDCSKDNTVLSCRKWVEENKGLFEDCEIKTNENNVGTVKNYNYILDKIDDHPFKIIAGDDLIAHNNIFVSAALNKKHTLFCGFKLMFRDRDLVVDDDDIFRQFYLLKKKRTKDRNLKLLKLGFVISTPQTLYSKELYDISNAKEFNSTFRFFEDNPTWYCMLKNVNDIGLEFAEYPIVIYRLSEKSVSNATVKVNAVFQAELSRLYDTYIREGTLFDRLYFTSIKRDGPNFLNLSKYVKRVFHFKCRLYAYLNRNEFLEYRNKLESVLDVEKKHLNKLLELEEK